MEILFFLSFLKSNTCSNRIRILRTIWRESIERRGVCRFHGSHYMTINHITTSGFSFESIAPVFWHQLIGDPFIPIRIGLRLASVWCLLCAAPAPPALHYASVEEKVVKHEKTILHSANLFRCFHCVLVCLRHCCVYCARTVQLCGVVRWKWTPNTIFHLIWLINLRKHFVCVSSGACLLPFRISRTRMETENIVAFFHWQVAWGVCVILAGASAKPCKNVRFACFAPPAKACQYIINSE